MMRTKNFIKTVKELDYKESEGMSHIEESQTIWRPIPERTPDGMELLAKAIKLSTQSIKQVFDEFTDSFVNYCAPRFTSLIDNWQIETRRLSDYENLPIPNIEVTVEGLPPISPTYTGMRPPILLTASQAEQIVEMGGDIENVIIADRLPPIPEDCQVPTTTMPCSRYYATDLHPVDYDSSVHPYETETRRLIKMSSEDLRLEIIEDGYELTRLKASLELCRQKILRKEAIYRLARQKMHNCPYFANSHHLKCTANPTNTNCLECNDYEYHDSNKMDS